MYPYLFYSVYISFLKTRLFPLDHLFKVATQCHKNIVNFAQWTYPWSKSAEVADTNW